MRFKFDNIENPIALKEVRWYNSHGVLYIFLDFDSREVIE